MRPIHPLPLCAIALLTCACPRSNNKSDKPAMTVPASAGTASTAPSSEPAASASAVPVGPPPVCKVESRKSWATGANKLTGLTDAELPDGRVAIGFAIGLQPAVLVIGKNAEGQMRKIPLIAGTHLADIPKPGVATRHLQRVTPVKFEGDKVRAFVDFKDKYKDKRTLVACGPAETDEWWVAFNDIPIFEREDKSADARKARFKKNPSGEGEYHEIRDCRTFADLEKGTAWVAGSGLHGTLKADGTMSWQSTFFIDTGAKSHEMHIHTIDLKGDPPTTMSDYEVPVSARLRDGSYLIAARAGARLLVGLLDENKRLKGEFASYPGFPTLPDLAWDGDDLILTTSMAKGKSEFGLRALRVPGKDPKLAKYLTNVYTDAEAQDSETDPDFMRDAKGQHWLAHIEGERGKGRLSLAPIDDAFRFVGRPFTITEENERASSARLMPMRDGGIMVVFLREAEKTVELVTEEVHCEVSK